MKKLKKFLVLYYNIICWRSNKPSLDTKTIKPQKPTSHYDPGLQPCLPLSDSMTQNNKHTVTFGRTMITPFINMKYKHINAIKYKCVLLLTTVQSILNSL